MPRLSRILRLTQDDKYLEGIHPQRRHTRHMLSGIYLRFLFLSLVL